MTWWILGIVAVLLIFFGIVSILRVNSRCEDSYNNIIAEKKATNILIKLMHEEGVNLTENASNFYIERLGRNLFKFKRLSDGKYSNEYACVSKYKDGYALVYKEGVGWIIVDENFNEYKDIEKIAEFLKKSSSPNPIIEINAGIIHII